jgi:membrane-bound lytic murein transglycosylase D
MPDAIAADLPTSEAAEAIAEDPAVLVEPDDDDAVGAVDPGAGETEEAEAPEVVALVEPDLAETPDSALAPPDAPVETPDGAPVALAVPGMSADSPWRRIDNDAVMVDALETLGHFAEWLELPADRLRRLNNLSPRRPLRLGQRIRLDFSRVPREVFLERRLEYHKGVEEDFFGSFRVTGTIDHVLRPGETLWTLSHKTYAVPTWLIHRYNPDVDLARLTPGLRLVIPVVEKSG